MLKPQSENPPIHPLKTLMIRLQLQYKRVLTLVFEILMTPPLHHQNVYRTVVQVVYLRYQIVRVQTSIPLTNILIRKLQRSQYNSSN